jgi:hypothetical protein
MDPIVARKTWRTLEPYHGLVYFAPEAAAVYDALGMGGFDAYFASRAAALGAVGPEVVVATFFNFRPSRVHSAIPRAWEVASANAWVAARLEGVDASLRARVGDEALSSAEVGRAAALAAIAAEAARDSCDGRPLGLAHLAVPRPGAAHLALWHSITALREHRGDGHVACLVEAGLDGIGALVMHAASGEVPAAVLRTTRGWSEDEWAAAVAALAGRGLVDGEGAFTDAGKALRERIEQRTDELAVAPWAALGEERCAELRGIVRPLSKAIVEGGSP